MPANLKLAIHGWNTMTRITDVRGDIQAESAGAWMAVLHCVHEKSNPLDNMR